MGLWTALARALREKPPRTRLSAQQAEEIGRKGLGAIHRFAVESPEGAAWATQLGAVPRHVFEKGADALRDGSVTVLLHDGWGSHAGPVWEVSTAKPGERGGHTKLFVDDETGQIVEAVVIPH
jgi:hypothetical protein